MISDFLASSWSFFFRWPIANADVYRPMAVFLGPCLQTAVFLFFSVLATVVLGSEQYSWMPFLGWIGLSMLTGFFHEDGLADTADSLGVSKFNTSESLEKIHLTFKDPRLGTFGVSALVLFWLFRYSTSAQGLMGVFPYALACLFSRTISLGLGLYFYPRVPSASSARSSHIMQTVTARSGFTVLLFSVLLGIVFCFLTVEFFSWIGFGQPVWMFEPQSIIYIGLSVFAAGGLSGFMLMKLVRRSEALNGDLLGATVCFSEVILTICFLRFF